jgi:hypothetical protein
MIAASEAAEARRWSRRPSQISNGTMAMPPPTPNIPLANPPIAPAAANRQSGAGWSADARPAGGLERLIGWL